MMTFLEENMYTKKRNRFYFLLPNKQQKYNNENRFTQFSYSTYAKQRLSFNFVKFIQNSSQLFAIFVTFEFENNGMLTSQSKDQWAENQIVIELTVHF